MRPGQERTQPDDNPARSRDDSAPDDPYQTTTPAADGTRKRALLTVILVSYLMIVLDISIVIAALPKIHSSLGFSTAGLSWVQNA